VIAASVTLRQVVGGRGEKTREGTAAIATPAALRQAGLEGGEKRSEGSEVIAASVTLRQVSGGRGEKTREGTPAIATPAALRQAGLDGDEKS